MLHPKFVKKVVHGRLEIWKTKKLWFQISQRNWKSEDTAIAWCLDIRFATPAVPADVILSHFSFLEIEAGNDVRIQAWIFRAQQRPYCKYWLNCRFHYTHMKTIAAKCCYFLFTGIKLNRRFRKSWRTWFLSMHDGNMPLIVHCGKWSPPSSVKSSIADMMKEFLSHYVLRVSCLDFCSQSFIPAFFVEEHSIPIPSKIPHHPGTEKW